MKVACEDADAVVSGKPDASRVTARIEILTPVPPLVDWLGIYWLYKTTPEKKKFPAWGVRELPRDGDIGCLLRLWEKKPDAGFKLLPERLLKLQWMADASPPACRTEINAR